MVVVIPLVSRLRTSAQAGLQLFLRELIGLNLLLAVVVTMLLVLALPVALERWSGLQVEALDMAIKTARPFAIVCGLGMVIALQSVLLMSGSRHQNSLLEAVPSLVLLAVLSLPEGWVSQPLLWGSIGGFLLHLLFVGGVSCKHSILPRPRFRFTSPAWPAFWSGMGMMLAAQALASSTLILDQLFAAPLGSGAVSLLSFSNRVLALMLGLGAMAVSRATLPVFSDVHAVQDPRAAALTDWWVRWVMVVGLCVAVVAWPMSLSGVRLLFERGAFSAVDSESVARLVQFGLLQIPAYFGSLVLISHFSSQHRYRPVLMFGLAGMLAKLVSAWVLVPRFGLQGIMLSTSAFYIAGLIMLVYQRRSATGR
jgi:peptidoglycan biosynthesis protein MviN/MurJ (putative lipid II flippase)